MQLAFVVGAIVTTLMTGPLVDVFMPAAEVEAEPEVKPDRRTTDSVVGLAALTGDTKPPG
jgi:hypothetical protein